MAKITILGAGGFGVSLAIAAYQNQHQVTVWDISEQIVEAILRDGEHKTKLPGVKIPKGIAFTTDPHCMEQSDMVVLYIRSVAQRVKPFLTKDTILVNASKGLEEKTFLTMSQIIQSEYPENAVGVITGPSHAEEVGRGVPTTVVAASCWATVTSLSPRAICFCTSNVPAVVRLCGKNVELFAKISLNDAGGRDRAAQ